MRHLLKLVLAALLVALAAHPAAARSRIKDIVSFEGVRDNQIVGIGLVFGLNGTGDSLRNIPFTQQSLQSMLERLGINTRAATNIDTKNVAMVMVTANLPPFAGPGSRVDVSVSAMGDAKSLLGGTLVMTSLQGPDGEIYAVAQGTVQTGSISASGASGSSVTRGVPTAGRVVNGAIVEKEGGYELAKQGKMRLTLRNPDFNTSKRIATAINARYPGSAVADNGSVVTVNTPASSTLVDFITSIEPLEVEPDEVAKVIIDEVSGVIVMGQDVRVSTVAIAQGNLTISVEETPKVSQPAPFSQGQTTVVPSSQVKVDEEKGKKLIMLKSGASLASLVRGLNALGVTPRDMISILQAINRAGALQADVEVM
jgi:flagellar P-ring protein precursor FlgI